MRRRAYPWICSACAEHFYARIPPAECYSGDRRVPDCPGCGDDADVVRLEDERERDEDDGLSGYSDPRDERDERRLGERA